MIRSIVPLPTPAILLLVILPFLFSCEEEKVRFQEPQPRGVKPDGEIREKFRGLFFSQDDSTWLHVTESRVWVSSDSAESGEELGESKDVEKAQKAKAKASVGKDSEISVSVSARETDTADSLALDGYFEEVLLDLKQESQARYFRGYYFLNKPVEEGAGYKVRILRATREGLLLCRIQTDSVLHLLEKEEFIKKEPHSEGDHGEETWTLHPSRKELRRLIRMGLFSDIRLYRRRL